MRKAMMIIVQVLIFTGAWFIVTPDQLIDETYLFGLFGSYDVIRGNTHWVLIGAALLSIINILVWWPKAVKQTVAKAAEGDKSTEAGEKIDQEPKTPTLD